MRDNIAARLALPRLSRERAVLLFTGVLLCASVVVLLLKNRQLERRAVEVLASRDALIARLRAIVAVPTFGDSLPARMSLRHAGASVDLVSQLRGTRTVVYVFARGCRYCLLLDSLLGAEGRSRVLSVRALRRSETAGDAGELVMETPAGNRLPAVRAVPTIFVVSEAGIVLNSAEADAGRAAMLLAQEGLLNLRDYSTAIGRVRGDSAANNTSLAR